MVWVVFNTLIALMLMELGVFQALGKVLGLYSNIAISWMMAVVADLVVNKPLGLSPRGIEFKRAHLYDVNPVGVGAMGIASVLSVAANLGMLGAAAQAFSALIAMVTAFVAAPLIAWVTRGRYYLARRPAPPCAGCTGEGCRNTASDGAVPALLTCTICERAYERDDMADCPAYLGAICSLCCSLDARCHDLCKPQARLSAQWAAVLRAALPRGTERYLDTGLGHYLLLMAVVVPLLAGLFGLMYHHELQQFGERAGELEPALRLGFMKLYAALLLISGIVAWWLVLTHKSRQVAQEESNRQTHLLVQEIESHRRTDEQLQQAKLHADLANQAKTRYVSAISHELRTPLNSILGYAQLLDEDTQLPPQSRQAVTVIRRGGDHLLSLIEGTLDIARIESGKLTLEVRPMRFAEGLRQLLHMFELQAAGKGLDFVAQIDDGVPEVVRADEKRLRQILINVLGNAVKFTREGRVVFRMSYAREMAHFEIEDTGPGMSTVELERVFEPFARGGSAGADPAGGTGLGLTISKMLTDLMGGEMTVRSTPGQGTVFRIRLFLPQVRVTVAALPRAARTGYRGERRRIWVVDNEEADRGLLVSVLQPLGFEVRPVASGLDCLAQMQATAPHERPHAVLMDLAMPGIDGWETVRRIRARALSAAPVAIVSANAFDKGLDNDVGIGPEDFIVKPVRVSELLDWLGRRLGLDWVEAARAPAPAPEPAPAMVVPTPDVLKALGELVDSGYVRGIHRMLDRLAEERPECSAFVTHLRTLARQFQLDAMAGFLRKQQAAAGRQDTAASEPPP